MAESARAQGRVATREAILAAAGDLFARRGFVSVSTADIAEQAGVAHGTVFLHFPARNDLILAVVEESHQAIAADLRDLAVRTLPNLKEVLSTHVAAIADQEGLYAHLVAERRLLPASCNARLMVLQSAVAFYFRAAAERAGLMERYDGALLFNTWLGLIHQYVCNPDLFARQESVLSDRADVLVSHFLDLLRLDWPEQAGSPTDGAA